MYGNRTRIIALSALTIASLSLAGVVQARGGHWVYRDAEGHVVSQRGAPVHSVARLWNEAMLNAIRRDLARPTVHARNLFHVTIAMWDAWAAYDATADTYLHHETATAPDIQAAREEAISYASYRLLSYRFSGSPGAVESQAEFDALMATLGYDINDNDTMGDTPSALGNRIAQECILFGVLDGSNEIADFANQFYVPENAPLVPALPGNPDLTDPDRWQPLALDFFVDQGGNVIVGGYPEFLSPEWGQVNAFALRSEDLTVYQRDGFDYWVFHDPGAPPYFGDMGDDYYRWGFEMVSVWSAHLDPSDGVEIDISPVAIGDAGLPDSADYETFYDFVEGGDASAGYLFNPVTGLQYQKQIVPRGDYGRILAEFWADGPDSETPPGHWFTILNYVVDHPLFEKRFGGSGPILDDLEFDVKAYFAMAGAMHDSAVAAWGIKGWYDYIRPVSALRHLADLGQRSDPMGASYDPNGITLHPGLIELVTSETTAIGERHQHLFGSEGKIALYAWRGPDFISNPDTDEAGVGWILADNWWPYQRPSFVTPPFAGYVSGHSTYSRAAAEVMELLTGSPYFPGGVGEFFCPQNDFLVFEEGPSVDVTLQWASYVDASDQCSLSRIWGGIHPPADDLPGRHIGKEVGPDAYRLAVRYMNGLISCPGDTDGDGSIGASDIAVLIGNWGETSDPTLAADIDGDGDVDAADLAQMLGSWGPCAGP